MEMVEKEKIVFCWSSGKDSSMALYEVFKQEKRYSVEKLLTTVSFDYDRVCMHGVRNELLKKQADAIGIPLEEVVINSSSSNTVYEIAMEKSLLNLKKAGISTIAFGDIYLEELKEYRVKNMEKIGFKTLFPLWKRDTVELAKTFIEVGFKAIVTCVDTNILAASYAGRIYDSKFLADLPSSVDPCGENGEFHTFVYEGPIFKKKLLVEVGETVVRDNRFAFCDLR